jgi:DNA repair protein RadD
MTARDYQAWAVQETWRYFEQNTGNPVIAMPVGTGKSHVIAELLKSILQAFPRTRAMMLTHVKELIEQNYKKFVQSWPTAPVAGLNKKEFHQQITFAGIASVAKKAMLFGHIDLVFVDECDLVSPSEKTMYAKFFAELRKRNPHMKVIGLTATPWRAGLGAITNEGGIFTDVCVDMTGIDAFNWFIDEGYLVPLIPKPTKLELDVSGVHMRGGEFIASELQHAVDKQQITRRALLETLEIAHDRHSWLVFASGVEHAQHIAEELNSMGVSAEAVYSGMDAKKRDDSINAAKAGELRALVNNNILTTGFDMPRLDLILMLRPTGSSRLWVQMLGRGTRPWYADGFDLNTKEGRLGAIAASPKQNTLVLDFAANIRKLGPINDPVIPRQKGKGPPGEAPIKLCEQCDTYNHASARYCGGKPISHPEFNRAKGCGHEFLFVTKLKVEASTATLIKGKMDLPIVESFKVDHITYTLHHKVGSEPMVKVTYYCGLKNFVDYVCVQHAEGNYAKKRARDWWKMRSSVPMPENTDDALDQVGNLAYPTHLEVWINQKYPTIQRYCFDGSNFGRNGAAEVAGSPAPSIVATKERDRHAEADRAYTAAETAQMSKPSTYNKNEWNDMDDDIPF